MKNIINILALLLIFNNYSGQEPVFSQFYFNPMYLNPALAGMDNNFRLFVNNKNQWSKVHNLILILFLLIHGKTIKTLLYPCYILLEMKESY